ncbi:hypothetical protein LGH82_27355 [Mesorhizobium sp. PAMC28654]|uniref:hypothetical protein n=1 Tax=Mesorhizobium sp. PAMC28654 TaxID=2880934 RepID=UPI001D0B4748|nr:hypothetical protein [Mesorhizobium sp. PAMC28654]UDL88794.1 hypothetical protein LGH82_27355 [Mesorhizobium sp. PAMC28654]
MRMRTAVATLAFIALCASARAEDLKAFRLTIDGVAVDIDAGESVDITLPDGKQTKATLERNDFATFSGDSFSFVHPSNISVTKTNLGDNINQYLMASALGTIVLLQEYSAMNPVSLNQLMLQEMTKESVQAGATLTQEPTTRKLADGKELTGIHAVVKTRTESADFEVLSYGIADQGIIMVTRIDHKNDSTEAPLLDKFWESLKVKLSG